MTSEDAIEVFLRLHAHEAHDVSEDIAVVVDHLEELDLSPAFRNVLLALDEALGGL